MAATGGTKIDLSRLEIGPLEGKDCLRGFCCGEQMLDDWAREKAAKHHQRHQSRVTCARWPGNGNACGFYSLGVGSEKPDKLETQQQRQIFRSGFPLIYIHHLAVIRPMQGQGIGKLLFAHALKQAYEVGNVLPFLGIGLRPLNQRVQAFYQKQGFAVAPDESGNNPLMILPMDTLSALFSSRKA